MAVLKREYQFQHGHSHLSSSLPFMILRISRTENIYFYVQDEYIFVMQLKNIFEVYFPNCNKYEFC